MHPSAAVTQRLSDRAILAVLRASSPDHLLKASEVLHAGGIRFLEMTMTTPGALETLRAIKKNLGPEVLLGMGSILDRKMCQDALDAGADFIVTPVLKPELVPIAHAAGCPIMLGAYSPTEAQQAHEAGADFVKIFPADGLGPDYLRALRAPLPHLRLVPTGGVDETNIHLFFQAGAVAVAVGSSLLSARVLQERDWTGLKAASERLIRASQAR